MPDDDAARVELEGGDREGLGVECPDRRRE